MRKIKRLYSLLICCCVVVASSVSVFAAEKSNEPLANLELVKKQKNSSSTDSVITVLQQEKKI